MKLQLYIFVFLLCISGVSHSQDSILTNPVLNPEDFISVIRKYHPVIRQADIGIQKAGAEILIARGGFDPYFSLNSDQKTFDGKNYYRYTNPEIKIPTWYGIEVKAGFENNNGSLLNSEITPGKSSYAGISIPVAKNLVIDKRRAMLQQAKLFRQQTYAEREIIINDLLLDALKCYWNWAAALKIYQVTSAAVRVNETRFSLVKTAFRLGDRSAIDTTEALSQLQQFLYLQSEASVNLKNAAIELSNFLWKENNEYYELPEQTVTNNSWEQINFKNMEMPSLADLLLNASNNHPKLRYYRFKLSSLFVDRKLKFQELLPVVNLKTNFLNQGYSLFKGVGEAGFYENNNKFGIDIGIPLRFSEGRGSYKLAKLKIRETDFEIRLQQQQIENKIRYYFNELSGLQQQVAIYEAAYNNFQVLYRGEETKFKAGESSLFILNNRENKVLEAAQKLVELKAKFYKARVALQWAAGELK